MRSWSPAITTRTLSPISRHGTEYALPSTPTTQSACTLRTSSRANRKRWSASERAQSSGLRTPETLDRHLTRGAVHPLVGDITHPAVEVAFQCRPTLKASAGNRVLLHITDATLIFPFGAGPIGGARVRPKTPMLGEGAQPRIELNLAGHSVMMRYQPAIIVEQHLFGNPAKVEERALDTGKPALLTLIAKRPNIKPPRVAQGRHKQVHLHILVADRHPALAKVDLQLPAGWCLKANRCPRFRLQLAPQVTHRPLYCPQGQPDPLLPLELLPNHIGVAGMPAKPLRHPLLQPTQCPWPTPSAIGYPAALGQISADRHVAAPQLARDPPHTPPQRLQPQHRCDLLRRLHRLSPR